MCVPSFDIHVEDLFIAFEHVLYIFDILGRIYMSVGSKIRERETKERINII